MARLKGADEVITGELDPKYWVQKSDPLMLMCSVPFSLGELKVLDTYISRINAGDNTRRTVIFTKEEYETLMGLTSVDYRTLKKYTEGMLGKVVTLEMPDKQYLQFILFEKARYHKDEYGKAIIEMTCTELAKELFFCIGKYQYFNYALKNIINLNKKASYLLYLHILRTRFRGEWEISLAKLRDNVLDCKKQESYKLFKEFKRSVLDPAVKEINKKTDCHIEYEALKRGRTVTDIKFTYSSKEPDQLTLEDLPTKADEDPDVDTDAAMIEKYGSEYLAELARAIDYEFSKEDMEHISMILTRIHIPTLQYDSGNMATSKARYLSEKYAALNAEAAKKKQNGGHIGSRFAYFKGMLEKDTYKPAAYK